MGKAPNQAQRRAFYNRYYEVPHNVSSIFTGREEISRSLQDLCLPSKPPSAQKTQKRHVLYGLGGSAKTQNCLKFAQDHRERYDYLTICCNVMGKESSVRLSGRFLPLKSFLPQYLHCAASKCSTMIFLYISPRSLVSSFSISLLIAFC